jgi:hypothetical protein
MTSPKGTYGAPSQKPLPGRRCAGAAVAAGLLALVASCSSHSSTSSASASDGSIGVPLATSVTTATASWATFPMGHLDDPNNTFWEEFTLPAGADKWAERTPPDVADNGGLVTAPTTTGVVVGFRPSNLLSFSPLASTTDGGATYTPGLLSGGLADFPDALSVAASGRAVAFTLTQVLSSAEALTTWQPVATVAAINASSAGRDCRALAMTAVSVTDSGTFIGSACGAPGVVGLVEQTGSTFVSVGPQLPAADVKDRVEVDRLVRAGQGIAVLLSVRSDAGTSYLSAWNPSPGSGAWTLSASLVAVGALASTAVTSGGGFALLTKANSGALAAAVIAAPGSNWTQLPAPPAGTATISVANNRSDALVVDSATFIDYQLTGGQWVKAQTVQVAIPYDSSS